MLTSGGPRGAGRFCIHVKRIQIGVISYPGHEALWRSEIAAGRGATPRPTPLYGLHADRRRRRQKLPPPCEEAPRFVFLRERGCAGARGASRGWRGCGRRRATELATGARARTCRPCGDAPRCTTPTSPWAWPPDSSIAALGRVGRTPAERGARGASRRPLRPRARAFPPRPRRRARRRAGRSSPRRGAARASPRAGGRRRRRRGGRRSSSR